MRISKVARILGTLVVAAALTAGCARKVHVYEPGVYKGAKDPLLAKLATPELQAQLHQRFDTVQARQ